jgi:hypothetical protein
LVCRQHDCVIVHSLDVRRLLARGLKTPILFLLPPGVCTKNCKVQTRSMEGFRKREFPSSHHAEKRSERSTRCWSRCAVVQSCCVCTFTYYRPTNASGFLILWKHVGTMSQILLCDSAVIIPAGVARDSNDSPAVPLMNAYCCVRQVSTVNDRPFCIAEF